MLPTIAYLSDIYFGPGMLAVLPELLQRLSIRAPLVVTDKGLASLGFIERLNIASAQVFDSIETNPSEESVLRGLARYREGECDGVVGIGGGSPIDCAKCIGLLVHHPEPLSQYAFLDGGLPRITQRRPPLIAIPTTAGTGSEVGRAALITMTGGRKMAFLSPNLIPNSVICDATLTLELPPNLTAATGMDAISHCVETFCSPKFNPVADTIALDGLQRAYKNIREVVHHGSNLQARNEMMMAALQGGLSFQKGLGFVHSLSHPLGGLKGKRLHHGTLNAIFLPHVLRFNMECCSESMEKIAQAIGGSTSAELPHIFSTLIDEIGLPSRLRDLNVTSTEIDTLVELALNDHCSVTNPRKVTRADCERLYYDAY